MINRDDEAPHIGSQKWTNGVVSHVCTSLERKMSSVLHVIVNWYRQTRQEENLRKVDEEREGSFATQSIIAAQRVPRV